MKEHQSDRRLSGEGGAMIESSWLRDGSVLDWWGMAAKESG